MQQAVAAFDDHRLRIFAKPPTLVATEEHAHLKLHVQSPPVKRLSWAVADEIVAMAASAAEEAVWWTFCKHYRDDAAAAALWEKRDTNLDISPDNSSGLLDGDIDTLLQTAFAEKIGPIDNLPEGYCLACRIFTVVEEFKQRRRIIAWTRATNAEERRILGAMKAAHFIVPFPRVGTLRRRALYRYAAHLDLTKFFQQFELVARKRYAFVHKGEVYVLATVPTGAVGPPLLAQILLRAVVCLSIRECSTGSLVVLDTMIDNARICSNDFDALTATWNRIHFHLSRLGSTVGDFLEPIEQPTYEFLGMLFDHKRLSVSPTAKAKTKIAGAVNTLRHRAADLTLADCFSLFGTTVWTAQVLDRPLAELYWVVKFIRRLSRRIPMQSMLSPTKVWPCIVDLWSTWLETSITASCSITPLTPALKTIIAYTDASSTGWGAVIFDEDGVHVLAGTWTDAEMKLHINEKELLAVWYMLRDYRPPTLPSTGKRSMWLYIDNTTALSYVSKRNAKRYRPCSIIMGIEQLKENHGIDVEHVEYVSSAANFADGPSRQH